MVYEFDGTINRDDKNPILKNYNRSNLIYNSKYSSHEYHNIKNFNSLSVESKYPILASFYNE